MATRLEDRARGLVPFLPPMAKEVIFWCAVLASVASGAVLIVQMGSVT